MKSVLKILNRYSEHILHVEVLLFHHRNDPVYLRNLILNKFLRGGQ